MTELKAHYKLTSIEGVRPKGTQRPSAEDMEVLRLHLENAGIPRGREERPAMTEQEYTPTWSEIESAYVASRLALTDGNEDARSEEAHRWLAEHDRQVAERAWNEGRTSVALDMARPIDDSGMRPATINPYRKEAAGD